MRRAPLNIPSLPSQLIPSLSIYPLLFPLLPFTLPPHNNPTSSLSKPFPCILLSVHLSQFFTFFYYIIFSAVLPFVPSLTPFFHFLIVHFHYILFSPSFSLYLHSSPFLLSPLTRCNVFLCAAPVSFCEFHLHGMELFLFCHPPSPFSIIILHLVLCLFFSPSKPVTI